MKFVPNKGSEYVCDGCWFCCTHCECGPNGTPSPCDLKNRDCPKCPPVHSSNVPPLKFYKVSAHAQDPHWGTATSACFDLRACLSPGDDVKVFRPDNSLCLYNVLSDKTGVTINAGERAMIPTGLIFDIPLGYSVRIHSRSGLAIKQGMVLANHEGVIDSDYVEPTYLVMFNASTVPLTVFHGDRLAQGEMIPDLAYEVSETQVKPKVKTDRVGGFGSTGVSV